MLQFIRENINAIVSVSIMAIYWVMFNYRSVAANVNNIDKKRIEKGMTPMSEEEKKVITKTLRSSIVQDSMIAFISGIVALAVVYFF